MPVRALYVVTILGLAGCGRTGVFDTPYGPPPMHEPVCGDGFVEGVEQCDDGNTVETDACRAQCTPALCGDAVLFEGVELCDDGNLTDGDGCEADCAPPPCGNGQPDFGEQCDDGNADNTDGCLSSCVFAFCGDLQLRQGVEDCDDGNQLSTDACVDCRAAVCGDGHVWRGVEECDDGNGLENDECSSACRAPVCGDGERAGKEACDLGLENHEQPALLVEQEGRAPFAVRPVFDDRPLVEFYDHRSASSHIGFEMASESRVLFVLGRGQPGLSMVLNHGIDEGQGQTQPDARVEFEITGLTGNWSIPVVDDRDQEFSRVDASRAQGEWGFTDNTDGGVISGLPFPGNWTITIFPERWEGIERWVVFDGSLENRRALNMDRPLRIRAQASASECRVDCTRPTCGDGRLDGGEFCDDGNRRGGDGCSADCQRLD